MGLMNYRWFEFHIQFCRFLPVSISLMVRLYSCYTMSEWPNVGMTTSPVLHMTLRRNLPVWSVITPRRACATRGKVIDVGLYIYICKKFQIFFESFKVLSNTGRLLFEFNRLQYTLAAPEVFVASCKSAVWVQGRHRQKHKH